MVLPLLSISPIPVQMGLCVQVLQEQLIVLPLAHNSKVLLVQGGMLENKKELMKTGNQKFLILRFSHSSVVLPVHILN